MSGKSGAEVEWILIDEEPEAERICVGVVPKEKMSVGCAGTMSAGDWLLDSHINSPRSTVWVVRYCFDWAMLA